MKSSTANEKKQTHFSAQRILTAHSHTMFPVYKVFLVVTSVQQICALHDSLLHKRVHYDEHFILSQILEGCITKVHSDNRQLVSIKFTAATAEQTRLQSDLTQTLLSYTRQLDICYMFLDLKRFPNSLSKHRGFNIIFTDRADIFQ